MLLPVDIPFELNKICVSSPPISACGPTEPVGPNCVNMTCWTVSITEGTEGLSGPV